MNGGEFLQTPHLPKPLHCPLASSERLVRVSARLFSQQPVSYPPGLNPIEMAFAKLKAHYGGYSGGWGGIRTHETVARLPVFKTGAFNRSATHPH